MVDGEKYIPGETLTVTLSNTGSYYLLETNTDSWAGLTANSCSAST